MIIKIQENLIYYYYYLVVVVKLLIVFPKNISYDTFKLLQLATTIYGL